MLTSLVSPNPENSLDNHHEAGPQADALAVVSLASRLYDVGVSTACFGATSFTAKPGMAGNQHAVVQ